MKYFIILIVLVCMCIMPLSAADDQATVAPSGQIHNNYEQVLDANSWITTQTIGNAPKMDSYEWTGSIISWTHAFDVSCKAIFDTELKITAWDVDYADGEHDAVYINGVFAGYLQGSSDSWYTTVFAIDWQTLVNANGIINVDVHVDVDNTSPMWAVTIDYSQLCTHWDYGGEIRGYVFNDCDSSCTMNGSEVGISNVVLRLFEAKDPQPVKIKKALSTSDGFYHFQNVAIGDYIIKVGENSIPENSVCTTGGLCREVTMYECGVIEEYFGYKPDFMTPFFAGQGAYEPEIPEGKEGNDLVFVSGTQTFGSGDYSWHKAVDGCCEGWGGTTLARGNEDPAGPATAIFQFADGGMYKFNYITFMTDNGCDDDGMKYDRQTQQLEVLVSTTGLEDGHFRSLGIFNRKSDGCHLEWHKLSGYVEAKYVKLALILPNNCYEYWRQIVEFQVQDGSTKLGASPASNTQPALQVLNTTSLQAAYPNPFNPQTTIAYQLESDAEVTIHVYDLNGRLVETLVDEHQLSGHHQVTWDAGSCASGTYLVAMKAADIVQTQKIVLLK